MPEEVKRDLCAQSIEGAKLLNTFVAERIQKEDQNLGSKMKKRKLLTWKSTNKKTKVTVNNEVIELQEDRCLFARMMIGMPGSARNQYRRSHRQVRVFRGFEGPLCSRRHNASLFHEKCTDDLN